MTCTVVVGGFWGDEGKGKVVSYLAMQDKIDVTVRTGSINAGHTVLFKGKEYRLKLVPSSFVYDKCKLYVGPGANVHPTMFLHEVKRTGTEGRVWVDRKCSIIEEEHIRKDRKAKYLAERLSTTGQGVGPAVESRVKRTAAVAEEIPELEPYLADVALEVNKAIDEGLKVVVEGTQGFYLSLYHGTYPYVTSRDTSASGVCSEAGVPPTKVDEVLLVLKSFVTRVGHGPLPNELSEEEAVRRRWVEVATVTRRKRRAAPFNYELAKNAALVSGATQIALTKLDVLFPECKGTKSFDDLPREAKKFVMEVETKIGTPVTLIGTGPETDEMVDRRI